MDTNKLLADCDRLITFLNKYRNLFETLTDKVEFDAACVSLTNINDCIKNIDENAKKTDEPFIEELSIEEIDKLAEKIDKSIIKEIDIDKSEHTVTLPDEAILAQARRTVLNKPKIPSSAMNLADIKKESDILVLVELVIQFPQNTSFCDSAAVSAFITPLIDDQSQGADIFLRNLDVLKGFEKTYGQDRDAIIQALMASIGSVYEPQFWPQHPKKVVQPSDEAIRSAYVSIWGSESGSIENMLQDLNRYRPNWRIE